MSADSLVKVIADLRRVASDTMILGVPRSYCDEWADRLAAIAAEPRAWAVMREDGALIETCYTKNGAMNRAASLGEEDGIDHYVEPLIIGSDGVEKEPA